MSVFIAEDDKAKVVRAIEEVLLRDGDGIELVECKFFKQYGSDTVEALLWKKGGVDLNDCERVHGAVSDALDALDDLFEGAYTLNISSMGLDRPIVSDDDFRRALDTEIECRLTDKSKHHGILAAYDANSITLDEDGRSGVISRKSLTKVQPYVRF